MVSEISSVLPPLVVVHRQEVVPSQPPVSPVQTTSSLGEQHSSDTGRLLSQLVLRQDGQTQAALQIRKSQADLAGMDRRLADMKNTLLQVTKLYPPYPADNPERVVLLNQLGGLRKEIEALMVPPPYQLPGTQLPQVNPQSGKADTPQAIVIRQTELALPNITPHIASDQQSGQALAQIEQAQAKVAGARQAMWQEVARYATSADVHQIEQQSQSVRGYLARTPGVAIASTSAPQLAQAVA